MRLEVLMRETDKWTDTGKEQALRDPITACPDIELPVEMLGSDGFDYMVNALFLS